MVRLEELWTPVQGWPRLWADGRATTGALGGTLNPCAALPYAASGRASILMRLEPRPALNRSFEFSKLRTQQQPFSIYCFETPVLCRLRKIHVKSINLQGKFPFIFDLPILINIAFNNESLKPENYDGTIINFFPLITYCFLQSDFWVCNLPKIQF